MKILDHYYPEMKYWIIVVRFEIFQSNPDFQLIIINGLNDHLDKNGDEKEVMCFDLYVQQESL